MVCEGGNREGPPYPDFFQREVPLRELWDSLRMAKQVFLGTCERSLIRQVSVVQDDGEEGTMDVQAAVVVDEAQLSEFI